MKKGKGPERTERDTEEKRVLCFIWIIQLDVSGRDSVGKRKGKTLLIMDCTGRGRGG